MRFLIGSSRETASCGDGSLSVNSHTANWHLGSSSLTGWFVNVFTSVYMSQSLVSVWLGKTSG